MKPHKHAELIKAWADGAEIQWSLDGKDWGDTPAPVWDVESQYRIKPNKRKYRVAEMFLTTIQKIDTRTVNSDDEAIGLSCSKSFVRWLTDWIEYDATNTEAK